MEVCDIVQETGIKTILKKKKCERRLVVWGSLTNSCERQKVSEKQRRKGKIYPFECRVLKNNCSPWGCKEWDTTEQLNWTELNWMAQMSFLNVEYGPEHFPCEVVNNLCYMWLQGLTVLLKGVVKGLGLGYRLWNETWDLEILNLLPENELPDVSEKILYSSCRYMRLWVIIRK